LAGALAARPIFWVTVIANCVALAWFVCEVPLTLL
jgi:hypothetical protein